MKIKEVRDKSNDELMQELRELRAELFNLRSRKATGQLDKPHRFNESKKTIARILTVFKERKIEEKMPEVQSPEKATAIKSKGKPMGGKKEPRTF